MWSWIKNAASSTASWVVEHKAQIASTVAAVVVGTIVTLAVAAFIVGTGGLGAGVVAAVAAGAISGAVGGAAAGATGYLVDVALDDKKKFAAKELGKAVLVGAIVGGVTGGVLKGVGSVAGAKAADQAVELTAREVAKRAAVNGVAGSVVGGGTQLATNAAENLAQGAPITSNIFRGVPQATAIGGAVGVGSSLAEPLAKPVLDRIAQASARAGRSFAGAGSRPLGELGGEGAPPATEPQAPTSATGVAPQTLDSPAQPSDVAVADARGPPAPQPPRTGIAEIIEDGKVPTGSAGASNATPGAASTGTTSTEPSASSSEATPSAAPATRSAPVLNDPLGAETTPGARSANREIADCGQQSLSDYLRSQGIEKTPDEIKAFVGKDEKMNPIEVADTLHQLTGRNPNYKPYLTAETLNRYALDRYQPGERFIVGGANPNATLGHFEVGERTADGVVFFDPQAGKADPNFPTTYKDFVVIDARDP